MKNIIVQSQHVFLVIAVFFAKLSLRFGSNVELFTSPAGAAFHGAWPVHTETFSCVFVLFTVLKGIDNNQLIT